jgi:hypothetical protein
MKKNTPASARRNTLHARSLAARKAVATIKRMKLARAKG